jgi:hypothetical protein
MRNKRILWKMGNLSATILTQKYVSKLIDQQHEIALGKTGNALMQILTIDLPWQSHFTKLISIFQFQNKSLQDDLSFS